MEATRRSGIRSTVTFTLRMSGVLTAFRYRRLNFSPHQPASSMGAGMGISPAACMVEREIFPWPFSSTLPLNLYVASSMDSFSPEMELNSVTIIR